MASFNSYVSLPYMNGTANTPAMTQIKSPHFLLSGIPSCHHGIAALQEVVEKGDSSTVRGKTRLSSITVKFQGRGSDAG